MPEEVEALLAEVIRSRYLARQRHTATAVYREVVQQCRIRGLAVPSRGTLECRISQLDPVAMTTARQGRGRGPGITVGGWGAAAGRGLLEQVQIDHTVVDLETVDERHRRPIGRPYVMVAIDVASRCVCGLVVTLEAPSVGLCLAHMATDKRPWLERLGVNTAWPMSGKPREIFTDNAAEFKSEALQRGCDQHGIKQRYRPPGQPHFGGSWSG